MYNLFNILYNTSKFLKFKLPYNYINKFRKLEEKIYQLIINLLVNWININ